MSIDVVIGQPASGAGRRLKKRAIGATMVLALAFAAGGALAGCPGSTHTGSSGGGAKPPSSGGSVHTGAGGSHTSPCPTGGSTTHMASLPSLHLATSALGAVHPAVSTTHRTVSRTAAQTAQTAVGSKKTTEKLVKH